MSALIVKFREWDEAAIRGAVDDVGGTVASTIPQLHVVTVTGVPLEILQALPGVVYVTTDRVLAPDRGSAYNPTNVQDGPALGLDVWHLDRVNAWHAWKYTTGSPAVSVCPIDSGLVGHADMPTPADGKCYDPESEGTTAGDIEDEPDMSVVHWQSHGQAVFGMVYCRHNALGTRGIAPDCTPMFAQDNGTTGGITVSLLAKSMVWAVDNGARVLTSSTYLAAANDPAINDAYAYIWAHNALMCILAGNGNTDLSYTNAAAFGDTQDEAAYHHIVVGGLRSDDYKYGGDSAGSGYGPAVDVVAPAEHIYIAYPSYLSVGGYRYTDGTSFATPMVAGVLGLILSVNPALTNAQAREILLASSDKSLAPGFRAKFPNAGVLNAGKAVAMARATLSANRGVPVPYAHPIITEAAGYDGVTASIAGGARTVAVNGSAAIDVRGFCTDPIDSVELWANGAKVYSGPPAYLSVTSTGAAVNPLTVVAKTSATSTSETYDDVLVGELSITSADTGAGRAIPYHAATAGDPDLAQQWEILRLNAPQAWRHTKGSQQVPLAYFDTGVLTAHTTTDLDWPPSADQYYDGLNDAIDESGFNLAQPMVPHGTWIYSCNFSKHSGTGRAGLAPGLRPIVARVFNEEGGLPTQPFIDSIAWALSRGARILSFSIATDAGADAALQAAYDAGALIVAAAPDGYVSIDSVFDRPSELPNMVTVSGISRRDGVATPADTYESSNSGGVSYGTTIDITAPSADIRVGINRSGVLSIRSGTSYATPFVAGVCGLVWSVNLSLTREEVLDILYATADPSVDPTYKTLNPNAGIANAGKATTKALSTLPGRNGSVFPYVGFRKKPPYATGEITTPHVVQGGTVYTKLTGEVEIDLDAFSSDPVTSVELWVNGVQLYSGPPVRLAGTATYDPVTRVPLKVVARTAAGYAEETYTDVLVSTLVAGSADVTFSSSFALASGAGLAYSGATAIGASSYGQTADADARPGYYLARNLSLGRSWVAGSYAQIPVYGGDVALGTAQGYSADAVSAQVGAAILAASLGHSSDAISAQVAAAQFNAAQGFTADAVALAALLGDAAFAAGASFVTDAVTGHVVALTLGTGHTLVLDAGYQDALNAAGAIDLSMLHGQGQDAAYRGPDLVSDQTIAALLGLDCDAAFGPRYDAEQSVDALLAFATDARFSGTPAVVYPPIICTLSDLTVICEIPDLAIVRELQDLTFICDSAEVSDD